MMLSAALCGVPFLGAVIVSPYSSIQDLLLAVLSRTETHLYMKFFAETANVGCFSRGTRR